MAAFSNDSTIFESRNLVCKSEVKISSTRAVQGHVCFLHSFTFSARLNSDKELYEYLIRVLERPEETFNV